MLKRAIIFTIFFFISCSDKKGAISFTLNNTNLKCIVRKDSLYTYRFYNHEDKNFSTNIVSFTLKNETNKKLLFLVKNKYLGRNYSKINVFENSKLINFHLPLSHTYFDDEKKQEKLINYYQYSSIREREEFSDLIRLGADERNCNDFRSFLDESVVLHPDEKITINTILALPYMIENTIINTMNPAYYEFKENCKYEFCLKYELDANDLKKQLTKEQLEELKYNNIEIFNGTIETEKIPILVTFK